MDSLGEASKSFPSPKAVKIITKNKPNKIPKKNAKVFLIPKLAEVDAMARGAGPGEPSKTHDSKKRLKSSFGNFCPL